MSPVRLLVLDDASKFRVGLDRTDPAGKALIGALMMAGFSRAPGDFDKLSGPDLVVSAERVPAVARMVQDSLRQFRRTDSMIEANGAFDRSVIEVLGEKVSIRVRDPRHLALKRLNDLYETLRRIAARGRGLTVFAVPELDNVDRALLAVMRTAAPQSAVPALVQAHLAQLTSAGASPETIAELRDLTPETIGVHLARLERWALLRRSPEGDVGPAPKLAIIRF